MENNPIITIKNVGKRYNINHHRGGYVALRDVIMTILRSPFKFLKTKAKQIAGIDTKEEFWALKDINLEVKKGEVIGIIGPNGSGKSTLLKILSQITPPTTGEIIIQGKVGSLLEVGTGFHPELSGRENIFLNGAILGMGRKEIAEKFDRIVEFAGVDKFIDTPVKYYSSGMYVRLAFSVAAHMEPDILIIDEVLAVGDAEFQKKCLGKMDEVTKQDGRTILFVSHNMGAIEQLCTKTVLLEKGEIIKFGNTKEVIRHYTKSSNFLNSVLEYNETTDKDAKIRKISLLGKDDIPSAKIPFDSDFSVEVEYEIFRKIERAMLALGCYSQGELLFYSSDADKAGQLSSYAPGRYKSQIQIPLKLLNAGFYYLEININCPGVEFIDRKQNIPFEIYHSDNPLSAMYNNQIPGKIIIPLEYKNKKIS
ncbi:MAG: ABC transporter ATP-binding protein [Candidatus Pacebacteria bacterium]|jgi:lipopolysaccharide transport system ATP-binding protein|nr:ABC transporter ATP-binding protein [Candidatus Paceibacterota bacterium]